MPNMQPTMPTMQTMPNNLYNQSYMRVNYVP